MGRKALWLCVLAAGTSASVTSEGLTQKSISDVGWSVWFVGSQYDAASDTTTFTYKMVAADWEKDLSHWVLAVQADPPPTGSGINTSYGLDPKTGVLGFKWDDGQEAGTVQVYTLTLAGQIGTAMVSYSVKGGTYFAIGTVAGPGAPVQAPMTYSISGSLYVDADGNGTRDLGEPALANVTVVLTGSNGEVLGQTVTDANGGYVFADLTPGDYVVSAPGTTSASDFNEVLSTYFTAVVESLSVHLEGSDSSGNDLGYRVKVCEILKDLNPADPDGDSFTFSGTGKTIGFWKHQLTVAIKGKGHAQVNSVTLLSYLYAVEDLFLSEPFQFTPTAEVASALAVLSSTSSAKVDLLKKQLLGTELNHVSGRGLTGAYSALQAVLLAWGEYLALHYTQVPSAELVAAKDVFDRINNTGE